MFEKEKNRFEIEWAFMGWIKRYAASGSFHSLQTQKSPSGRMGFFTYLMPGSSLLSHGETPHYHRRYGVSLLSSAWGQVGPPRYSRQANSVYQHTSQVCRCNL